MFLQVYFIYYKSCLFCRTDDCCPKLWKLAWTSCSCSSFLWKWHYHCVLMQQKARVHLGKSWNWPRPSLYSVALMSSILRKSDQEREMMEKKKKKRTLWERQLTSCSFSAHHTNPVAFICISTIWCCDGNKHGMMFTESLQADFTDTENNSCLEGIKAHSIYWCTF